MLFSAKATGDLPASPAGLIRLITVSLHPFYVKAAPSGAVFAVLRGQLIRSALFPGIFL